MALYQYWRKNLNSHYEEIVRCLDLPPLLTYLVSKEAITFAEKEEINGKPSKRDMNCHLLEIISDENLNHLIEGLDFTGRQHLANSISGKFKPFFPILDLHQNCIFIICYRAIE